MRTQAANAVYVARQHDCYDERAHPWMAALLMAVLHEAGLNCLLGRVLPASTGCLPLFPLLRLSWVLPCEIVRCTQDVNNSDRVHFVGKLGVVWRSSSSWSSPPSVISAGVTTMAWWTVLQYEKRQHGKSSPHMSFRAVGTNGLRRNTRDLLMRSVCPFFYGW